MSAIPKRSGQTYLEQERLSDTKHEFCNGEIFAMSGASVAHNSIVANLIAGLHGELKKRPCKVYPSDMRVQLRDGSVYPDVSVVCGKPEFYDKDNLTNPAVIIEVLSPSTADYDAAGKYADYCRWSDDQRRELIHGEMYAMTAPLRIHQKIISELAVQIGNYLRNFPCEFYVAPFDVRLP